VFGEDLGEFVCVADDCGVLDGVVGERKRGGDLRAVQVYPASKQRARQAAAQPPVAPKKEMFWIDAIV
jgi:hypothetical protein